MEIEQAKFILSSFRPEGNDAQDPDFAEALALAAENRELGEWLSKERAQDATFSTALQSISLPEGLREDILASLNHDVEMIEDPELDTEFFNAFSEMQPPKDLREQILLSMEQEEQGEEEEKIVKGAFPLWKVLPAAAAAVVAISTVLIFSSDNGSTQVGPSANTDSLQSKDSEEEVVNVSKVDLMDVRVAAVEQMRSGSIQLASHSYEDSLKWLEEKKLPMATVPDALQSMKCLGVSEFDMNGGNKGSIVSFENSEGQHINMLVVANKSLEDHSTIPNQDEMDVNSVKFCPRCKYWVANMKQEGAVVILLSPLEKSAITEIF